MDIALAVEFTAFPVLKTKQSFA